MPYILNTDKDRQEMLKAIGVSSPEQLYSQLPQSIRLKQSLDLPRGLSEQQVKQTVESLAARNSTASQLNSFLGAGCYQHYLPAALNFIISQPAFVTAYTPYQPEISQGALQAIYEYQSYICRLTGMDVSNASLFDGASGLAEAALMALRVTARKKILVSSALHPQYRQTLRTYLRGFKFKICEIGVDKQGFTDIGQLRGNIDEDTACVIAQSPNFLGLIEDVAQLSAAAKAKNALLVLSCDGFSLAVLKEPAHFGVDIVCGDGQSLGGALNFGGPSFGFMAVKSDYLRQMPGRIVGRTEDKDGRPAYCLTLQAREQHIRREKATSNICSNQSLNAISAAVYLSLMGSQGLQDAAQACLFNARYLQKKMAGIAGVSFPFSGRFFHEFIWQAKDAVKILKKLYRKDIIAGLAVEKYYPQFNDCVLTCCTEVKSRQDMDDLAAQLEKALNG